MENFEAERVYFNLIKLSGYRGVNLTAPPLTKESFGEKINTNEYVLITGTRPDDDPRGGCMHVIILIKPDSGFSNKSAEFKKLVKLLPRAANTVWMFVTDKGLSIHIKKIIQEDTDGVRIEDHSYKWFVTEVPAHDGTPLHEIATEEALAFCERHYTTPSSFPALRAQDSMYAWMDLRPGMIVKVTRISETAGSAIAYRTCY